MVQVASIIASAGRRSRRVRRAIGLNWRLILALVLNLALWGAILLGVRALRA
jgi:hypothetical protein